MTLNDSNVSMKTSYHVFFSPLSRPCGLWGLNCSSPDQGLNTGPSSWKCGVLTTELPGNSCFHIPTKHSDSTSHDSGSDHAFFSRRTNSSTKFSALAAHHPNTSAHWPGDKYLLSTCCMQDTKPDIMFQLWLQPRFFLCLSSWLHQQIVFTSFYKHLIRKSIQQHSLQFCSA